MTEAKHRLREVVRRALDHRPQIVTRGHRESDAVVVVAKDDYERLLARRNLVEFLRQSPLAEAIVSDELAMAAFEAQLTGSRDAGRSSDL